MHPTAMNVGTLRLIFSFLSALQSMTLNRSALYRSVMPIEADNLAIV